MLAIMRAAILTPAVLLLGGAAPTALIPFPEGYRHWTHVKTGVNDPAHAGHGRYRGMYNIYANDLALEGYRKGSFPDGAVIVFDLHEAVIKDNNTQPAARRFIDVMRKDSKAYAAMGGWGYEEFAESTRDKRLVSTTRSEAKCHACHITQTANDHIYSRFVE